ncbi:MAG: Rho termination factor N-terminal domain-containing protein, partial [Anaerovoracaceae bacterium]
MDEKALKAMKLLQLRELAKTAGVEGHGKLKKADLILRLLEEDVAKAVSVAMETKVETEAKDRGEAVADTAIVLKPDAPVMIKEKKTKAVVKVEPKASGEKAEEKGPEIKAEAKGPESEAEPKVEPTAEPKIEEKSKEAKGEAKAEAREGKEVRDGREEVEGILELSDSGFGFMRFSNFLTSEKDIYVSNSQIKRFNLKTGDKIKGIARKPNQGERFGALLYVTTVNGDEPGVARRRRDFDQLTPIFPNERISLEAGSRDLSMRLIDLVAPIGKGQRGLIV